MRVHPDRVARAAQGLPPFVKRQILQVLKRAIALELWQLTDEHRSLPHMVSRVPVVATARSLGPCGTNLPLLHAFVVQHPRHAFPDLRMHWRRPQVGSAQVATWLAWLSALFQYAQPLGVHRISSRHPQLGHTSQWVLKFAELLRHLVRNERVSTLCTSSWATSTPNAMRPPARRRRAHIIAI